MARLCMLLSPKLERAELAGQCHQPADGLRPASPGGFAAAASAVT